MATDSNRRLSFCIKPKEETEISEIDTPPLSAVQRTEPGKKEGSA